MPVVRHSPRMVGYLPPSMRKAGLSISPLRFTSPLLPASPLLSQSQRWPKSMFNQISVFIVDKADLRKCCSLINCRGRIGRSLSRTRLITDCCYRFTPMHAIMVGIECFTWNILGRTTCFIDSNEGPTRHSTYDWRRILPVKSVSRIKI